VPCEPANLAQITTLFTLCTSATLQLPVSGTYHSVHAFLHERVRITSMTVEHGPIGMQSIPNDLPLGCEKVTVAECAVCCRLNANCNIHSSRIREPLRFNYRDSLLVLLLRLLIFHLCNQVSIVSRYKETSCRVIALHCAQTDSTNTGPIRKSRERTQIDTPS
jgi:hypothetical protein